MNGDKVRLSESDVLRTCQRCGTRMVAASFHHVKQLAVVTNSATIGHAVAARLQLDDPDAFT